MASPIRYKVEVSGLFSECREIPEAFSIIAWLWGVRSEGCVRNGFASSLQGRGVGIVLRLSRNPRSGFDVLHRRAG
jgi:hypothetical protein